MNIKKEINPASRIQSVDILRGAVMIIMALDHVRVFSGDLPGDPSAGPFLSRWITHYCASAFTFFAGTSAFLYLQKSNNKSDLTHFLITRGIWLVILEMFVVRFLWTFNLDISSFVHTNIIWTLGWSMVILAAFIRLKPMTIGIIGLVIIFIQQFFQFVPSVFPCSVQEQVANMWGFFYPSPFASKAVFLQGFSLPKVFGITVLYVILPWLGVMMAGYWFGQLLLMEFSRLQKYCLRIGVSAIGLFILAGSIVSATGSHAASQVPFLFKLLGQQKYPPSQLYLLMTLGPVIALVPWTEKVSGWLANALKTVGRVPMFYYLLHLLVIHLVALVVNIFISGSAHNEWYVTSPLVAMPEEFRWGLSMRYLVWAIVLVPDYFACRWYAKYKSAHPEKIWLKYL